MRRYIKNIKIGDKVKVYNTEDKTFSFSKVSKLWKHTSSHYYLLNGKTKVTEMHPYYVEGEWIRVKDLNKGDKLLDKSGHNVPIKSIKRVEESLTVYNMEVDGQHNYFANGLLVHNKDGYKGGDDHPKAARKDLNAKSTEFNQEMRNTTHTALQSMNDGYVEHMSAVGDAQGALNAGILNTDSDDVGTGAQGDLIAALKQINQDKTNTMTAAEKDARSTKVDTIATAGDAYRSASKDVVNAQVATGMVTAGERLSMDQDVLQEQAISGAQKTAEQSADEAQKLADADEVQAKQLANDTLKRAKQDGMADVRTAMAQELDTHSQMASVQAKNFNDEWTQSVKNITGDQNKNWSSYVRPSHQSKDSSGSTKVETPIPTTLTSGGVDDYNTNPGASSHLLTYSRDLRTASGVLDTVGFLDNSGQEISGFPTDANNEGVVTMADTWTGTAGLGGFQQTTGPDQSSDHTRAGGNKNDFVVPRCFSGSTWIEVQ